ncbi:hypothetical protein D3C86_1046270 [compost metagenome]
MDVADPAKQGDAVPATLPVPDRLVACSLNCGLRKIPLRSLQLLKADDVGLRQLQPPQQDGQTTVDPVHIIGRDLHRSGSVWSARPQAESVFDAARFSSSVWSPTWKRAGLAIVSISFQVIGAATGAPSRARAL